MDFTAVVLARMIELGIDRRELFDLVPQLNYRTLYAFLQGAPLNAHSLGHVLDALGMGVYRHDQVSEAIRDAEKARIEEIARGHYPRPRKDVLKQMLQWRLVKIGVSTRTHSKGRWV